MQTNVRIGTRGSELALWQAHHVKSLLELLFPHLTIEITIIKTTGDKILDAPLAKIGDKGLFTKELEHALLDNHIDVAVHSLKDIPTQIPKGLAIAALLEREDARDVFIARPLSKISAFAELPHGATIATGSLRRKAQLLAARPDFHIVDLRGNLNTRLKKLDESNWDGMILAKAGVTRLGWEKRITDILSFELMLPAVGQGALAIETRIDDLRSNNILHSLHHQPTADAITAERALLRELEGGCQIPIGAWSRIQGTELHLEAVIGNLDGTTIIRDHYTGTISDADRIGVELAQKLLSRGGKEILEQLRSAL
ncbi:MAG TPA: hydroxymethylbilane synthase [Bacteroidota bacterium]|nr:hydroxymethylbilane synthase [Bacteroidota bacterium]